MYRFAYYNLHFAQIQVTQCINWGIHIMKMLTGNRMRGREVLFFPGKMPGSVFDWRTALHLLELPGNILTVIES